MLIRGYVWMPEVKPEYHASGTARLGFEKGFLSDMETSRCLLGDLRETARSNLAQSFSLCHWA